MKLRKNRKNKQNAIRSFYVDKWRFIREHLAKKKFLETTTEVFSSHHQFMQRLHYD